MELGIFLCCFLFELLGSEEISKSLKGSSPPEITAINKDSTKSTQRFSLDTLSEEEQPLEIVNLPFPNYQSPNVKYSKLPPDPSLTISTDIRENKKSSDINNLMVSGENTKFKPFKETRFGSENYSEPKQSNQNMREEFNISYEKPQKTKDYINVCSITISSSKAGVYDKDYESERSSSTMNIFSNTNYFIDRYNCGPCVCFCTYKKPLKADCAYRNTRDIPGDLPTQIWFLDMSGNNITNLNFSKLLIYPMLHNFKISCDNQLKRITRTLLPLTAKTSNLQVINLSRNGIQSVDDDGFVVFPLLTNLTMRGNSLKQINNLTFFGLNNLRLLDLSSNMITTIHVDAFRNLINLNRLDLSCNPLLGYSKQKLPSLLFSSMKNLTELFVHGVSLEQDSVYPNKSLTQMPFLQRLSVDGLETEFGAEFVTLKYLQHLEVGSNKICLLKNLTENFFQNVPFLKIFDLIGCNSLSDVSPAAFSKVSLQSLTFKSLPNYDLYKAFNVLIGLQNSSLTTLRLVHLYNNSFVCKTLSDKDAKYLSNLTLEVLDLSDNVIIYISKTFIELLPKSLKVLFLRNNRLTSERVQLTMFSVLHNLIKLYISSQNMPIITQPDGDECPKVTEMQDIKKGKCRKIHDLEVYGKNPPITRKDNEMFEEMLFTSDNPGENGLSDQSPCEWNVSAELEKVQNFNEFPPKLEIIEASLFIGFGQSIFQAHNQMNICLSYINIYNSFFSTLEIGSHPFPKSIKIALMGSNYITKIRNGFFPRNNLLTHLDIHDNILGPTFTLDVNGTIFERLHKVIHLDIRTNFISDLPKLFFRGLVKLKWLRLSNNSLIELNTSFSNMNQLEYIDLSDNSIAWISKDVRDDLDEIASLHDLSIDLSKNPLPCTCNMLDVLHWMEGTKVVFLNRDNLICRFDDGSKAYIGDFKVRLRTLQRWCATKSTTFVICVASMIVIVFLLVFALLYRFRWRLRYVRYIVMAEFGGFKPKTTTENGFKFDAYILYTEETRKFVIRDFVKELEEKRGHNLCFEDRNFMPGSPIVSDIVSAVNNSHKTVPVVTPEFYDGDFSEYGVKMAVMEEIFKKRLALHLCIYQPTPSEVMSHDFLVAMKRNDYTEFPDNEDACEEIVQNFWDILSLAIGHTSSNAYSFENSE